MFCNLLFFFFDLLTSLSLPFFLLSLFLLFFVTPQCKVGRLFSFPRPCPSPPKFLIPAVLFPFSPFHGPPSPNLMDEISSPLSMKPFPPLTKVVNPPVRKAAALFSAPATVYPPQEVCTKHLFFLFFLLFFFFAERSSRSAFFLPAVLSSFYFSPCLKTRFYTSPCFSRRIRAPSFLFSSSFRSNFFEDHEFLFVLECGLGFSLIPFLWSYPPLPSFPAF